MSVKTDKELIKGVEAFRKENQVPQEYSKRIPNPEYYFYGKQTLEQAIASVLAGKNILLAGPKATGKNVLADNLAALFMRPEWNVSFHINMDVLCLIVIAFGCMTSIAGMDLGSLWDLSDFANILIAYCNIPLLYMGFKYVSKATEHFERHDGSLFTSDVIGTKTSVWDKK